jgi:TonB-dependent Receptor Plug Domain
VNLVNLAPAVRGIGAFGSYTQSANTDGRISIAGGGPSFNSFLVDGTANELHTSGGPMTSLSPDATEEIRIVSRSAPAEYGRTGGGVINYISKSGSNDFHGSMWTYTQNDTFDANDYFTKNANKPIPPLSFYQYGATAGGPIIRQELFFFFNWEGSKQTIGSTSIFTVPTTLQRKGDFSQTLNPSGSVIPIYDPNIAATQAPRTQFNETYFPCATESRSSCCSCVLSAAERTRKPGNRAQQLCRKRRSDDRQECSGSKDRSLHYPAAASGCSLHQ